MIYTKSYSLELSCSRAPLEPLRLPQISTYTHLKRQLLNNLSFHVIICLCRANVKNLLDKEIIKFFISL